MGQQSHQTKIRAASRAVSFTKWSLLEVSTPFTVSFATVLYTVYTTKIILLLYFSAVVSLLLIINNTQICYFLQALVVAKQPVSPDYRSFLRIWDGRLGYVRFLYHFDSFVLIWFANTNVNSFVDRAT